jgi:hypothetical protein
MIYNGSPDTFRKLRRSGKTGKKGNDIAYGIPKRLLKADFVRVSAKKLCVIFQINVELRTGKGNFWVA